MAWAVFAAVCVGIGLGLTSGWVFSAHLRVDPQHRKAAAKADLAQRLGGYVGRHHAAEVPPPAQELHRAPDGAGD